MFTPPFATGTWYAYQSGSASWYGGKFYFGRTANGELFLPGPFYTAAHKTLPLGTEVLVVNNKTGQRVVVRINDRGPYVGKRIIDLTYAAARRAGVYKPGTAQVTIYTRKPRWNGARKIFMYF
ncbi:MAG: septal ring lytic transglycosylase RlpA family protein [Lentisphaerae bacterium]|nr:septal ring lytic transglycosylase RlpA family protein [Lentisphaerota bacterium]MCP4100959.1 septal ring lytic transglycosylase RlpA family protein [Lentisphaerota bacterium]